MADPYARSVFHGKPLDNATIAALKLAEAELGYELTIFQGIGGAPASGGTHLEGRAVDLKPFDRERKLRVLKDVGFAAWHRPQLWRNGVKIWGAHIHAVLIFESRTNTRGLAPAGFRQIASYDRGRDGLKADGPDPTYRPDPKAVFTRAEYEATEEDEVTPEDIDKIAEACAEKLLATKIDTKTGEWTVKALLRGTYNNVVGED
jgi:hypothetical protein